jgi:hypothetical protein
MTTLIILNALVVLFLLIAAYTLLRDWWDRRR